MPVYEYRCKRCEKHWEDLRPVAKADATAPCPTCGAHQTVRLLSVFAARVGSAKMAESESCASSLASGMPCCRMTGGCQM